MATTHYVAVSPDHNLGRFIRNLDRLIGRYVHSSAPGNDTMMIKAHEYARYVDSVWRSQHVVDPISVHDACTSLSALSPIYQRWLEHVMESIPVYEREIGLSVHFAIVTCLVPAALHHARHDVIAANQHDRAREYDQSRKSVHLDVRRRQRALSE
jgi:hypothetical protein